MNRRITIVLITFAITNLLFNLLGLFIAGKLLNITAWIGLGVSLMYYGPQLLVYLLLCAAMKKDIPAYLISGIVALLGGLGILAALSDVSITKLGTDIANNGAIFWITMATIIAPVLGAAVYLKLKAPSRNL